MLSVIAAQGCQLLCPALGLHVNLGLQNSAGFLERASPSCPPSPASAHVPLPVQSSQNSPNCCLLDSLTQDGPRLSGLWR